MLAGQASASGLLHLSKTTHSTIRKDVRMCLSRRGRKLIGGQVQTFDFVSTIQ